MWEEIYKSIIENIQLILGWFLGITSTLIVEKIKKLSKKKEVQRGIISEIKNIQMLVVGFCVTTTLESKLLTEEWSNFIKPYFEKLFLSGEFEYHMDSKETTDKIKELISGKSNEVFFQYMQGIASIKEKNKSKTNLTVAKLDIPYINSNFGFVSLFNEQFQMLLSKFKREVDLINSDAEQIWYYHTKTFDKITDMNHDVVVQNIANIIARVARRSKGLIKLTQQIIEQ